MDIIAVEDIGYLKSVWQTVRRSSNATVQKGQTIQKAEDTVGQRMSHGKTLEKLRPKTQNAKVSNGDSILDELRDSASFFQGDKDQLSQTEKTPKLIVDDVQIATFQSQEDSQSSSGEREAMLVARVEQYRCEVAKKDAEITNLKRKIKELKTLQRGMQDFDTDLVSLSIENSRLTKNISRLSDLVSGHGRLESTLPSVTALLYPPYSNAFMGVDENQNYFQQPSKPRQASNDKSQHKKRVRPCCRTATPDTINNIAFDYDELCNWVPSAVHRAVKQLAGKLGLSVDKETLIKAFVVRVNKSMLQRNHEALTVCSNMCKKEVKEAKRQFIDTPIEIKSQVGQSKTKSDRAAFMEGAGWILAKLQADVSLASKNISRVIDDVSAGAAAIVSAMHYTNDSLKRVARKMTSYESNIKEQMAEELKLKNMRRPMHTTTNYGTKEAEKDHRMVDSGDLSDSF